MALLDLSENRLVSDLLASISLRTLRYVRLGLAADPDRIATAVETWRAVQRAVTRRDIDEVLETAVNRMDASRDAAVRAIVPEPPSPASRKTAAGPARTPSAASPRRPPEPAAPRQRSVTS